MPDRSCVTLVFASLLLAGPALAGQADVPAAAQPGQSDRQGQEAPAAPTADDEVRIRETVVVTATRSEGAINKTPVSVSAITAAELQARPVQNIDQQIALTEGVYVQRFQGPSAIDTTVALRGFNGASRTLVMVDGHPVNDAYSGGVNWTGLPMEQIQSIEVARGPFSSLYGGNALGGVINIRTRAIDRRAFDFTGEYGTYASNRIMSRYSDRFAGRFGVTVGVERFSTDGYNSRVFTATPGTGTGTLVTGAIPTLTTAGARAVMIGEGGRNVLDRHAYRARGEYVPGTGTVASVQYLYSGYEYRYDGYNSYLRDAAGRVVDSGAVVFDDGGTLRRVSVTPNNFLQGPGEQRSHFTTGTFQHTVSDRSLLRVDGGVYFIPSYQFRSLGTGNTLSSGPGSLTDGARLTNHLNAQYNLTLDNHAVVAGTETRYERATNEQYPLANWTDPASTGAQSYFATGRAVSQSAYVQDQFTVANNLTFVVGSRYDFWRGFDGASDSFTAARPREQYPARSRNQLTGKAALGYTLPGEWNLRASVGTAFRTPNVFELYATTVTASGAVLASNASLVPETVKSWEAGVRKQFRAGTSVDAAYYENRVRDLIYRQTDFAVDPTGNYRINQNAGAGLTRGLELSVRQQLAPGFELRTNYSRIHAVVSSNPGNTALVGKRITGTPDHSASVQLLGGRGRLAGSLSGRYTGRVFSTDTNTDIVKGVPGSYSPYFTADGSLSYNLTAKVQPYVSAENLLNRRYFVFYRSPGRTVFGGLRVRL